MNIVKIAKADDLKTKPSKMEDGQVGILSHDGGFNGILVIKSNDSIVALNNGDCWDVSRVDVIFDVILLPKGTKIELTANQ